MGILPKMGHTLEHQRRMGNYQMPYCGRSKGSKEKISKMRTTCKSHTDDKRAKGL